MTRLSSVTSPHEAWSDSVDGTVTGTWALSRRPTELWIEAFMRQPEPRPWLGFDPPVISGTAITWKVNVNDMAGASDFVFPRLEHANNQCE